MKTMVNELVQDSGSGRRSETELSELAKHNDLIFGVDLAEMLIEEIDGPSPGEFRGGFIVAWRGVVVKAVVHARVHIGREFEFVLFQRLFECIPRRPEYADRVPHCESTAEI